MINIVMRFPCYINSDKRENVSHSGYFGDRLYSLFGTELYAFLLPFGVGSGP